MANIIESTLASLDGVMGEPHVWARAYFDDNARPHSLEQLEHYTRDSAWFLDQDGRLGQLRPGYHAELAVLSGGYFSVPADSLKDLKSVTTIVGGKVVYSYGTFHSERRSPMAPGPQPLGQQQLSRPRGGAGPATPPLGNTCEFYGGPGAERTTPQRRATEGD